MIKFDLDKPKIIKTKIKVQNVDEENVDFILRLIIDNVEYGFKGVSDDGEVIFKIPPLRDYIDQDVNLDEEYPIRIETIANERFFQRPWSDSAKFTSIPKLELEEVTEDDDLAEEQGAGVSVESIEDDDIVERFRKAKEEVLKEKKCAKKKKKKKTKKTSEKFLKHIKGDVLDETTRLKKLLAEARRKKNEHSQ